MDARISAKYTSQKIETHSNVLLQFSAMDETPAYVTDILISPKSPVKRIPGKIVNKTRNFSNQKDLLIKLWFFSIQTNTNSWMCIKGLSQITPGARTVSKIT